LQLKPYSFQCASYRMTSNSKVASCWGLLEVPPLGPDHHPSPRAVVLSLQHNLSLSVPTRRRGLWREFILAFFFKPLACQAALDLRVFVFGRVAQHLDARVLRVEFLIVSPNGLSSDRRRASRIEGYRILRPEIYQLLRVLRQCGVNVCLVELFNGR
jgi:hypothetical protein